MHPERNAVFLQEMGLAPLWTRRARAPEGAAEAVPAEPVAMKAEQAAEEPAVAGHAKPVNHIAAAWDDDAPAAVPAAARGATMDATTDANPDANPDAIPIARMDWDALRAAVAGCTRCNLCRGRTKTVFGTGDQKARWLFVGEGPGRNEDRQGEPFVGPAGKLLDNMLAAMGLARGANAYIANVVKCRPKGDDGHDRPPAPDEIASCMPYLQRQIALIDPTVIVALGKTAALAMLGLDPATPVAKLRGVVHRHEGRPLIVTYHPAYLLRSPADKRKTWADLCLAMSTYAAAP